MRRRVNDARVDRHNAAIGLINQTHVDQRPGRRIVVVVVARVWPMVGGRTGIIFVINRIAVVVGMIVMRRDVLMVVIDHEG